MALATVLKGGLNNLWNDLSQLEGFLAAVTNSGAIILDFTTKAGIPAAVALHVLGGVSLAAFVIGQVLDHRTTANQAVKLAESAASLEANKAYLEASKASNGAK